MEQNIILNLISDCFYDKNLEITPDIAEPLPEDELDSFTAIIASILPQSEQKIETQNTQPNVEKTIEEKPSLENTPDISNIPPYNQATESLLLSPSLQVNEVKDTALVKHPEIDDFTGLKTDDAVEKIQNDYTSDNLNSNAESESQKEENIPIVDTKSQSSLATVQNLILPQNTHIELTAAIQNIPHSKKQESSKIEQYYEKNHIMAEDHDLSINPTTTVNLVNYDTPQMEPQINRNMSASISIALEKPKIDNEVMQPKQNEPLSQQNLQVSEPQLSTPSSLELKESAPYHYHSLQIEDSKGGLETEKSAVNSSIMHQVANAIKMHVLPTNSEKVLHVQLYPESLGLIEISIDSPELHHDQKITEVHIAVERFATFANLHEISQQLMQQINNSGNTNFLYNINISMLQPLQSEGAILKQRRNSHISLERSTNNLKILLTKYKSADTINIVI